MVKLQLRWTSREALSTPSAHFRQQTSRLAVLYALRGIPLPTIRGIAAIGPVMRFPAIWQFAFERASSVTTVTAAGPSGYGACVLDFAPTAAILQESQMLFPTLKTMHLSHFTVNRTGEHGALWSVYDYLRILLRTWRDAVREDGTSKALTRLSVKDMDLTDEHALQLGGLLSSGQIEWDRTVNVPL